MQLRNVFWIYISDISRCPTIVAAVLFTRPECITLKLLELCSKVPMFCLEVDGVGVNREGFLDEPFDVVSWPLLLLSFTLLSLSRFFVSFVAIVELTFPFLFSDRRVTEFLLVETCKDCDCISD